MERAANELSRAAYLACEELWQIEAALERAASDISDRHLRGRIWEAKERVHRVAEVLGWELDRPNPSQTMLRTLLRAGWKAILLVGAPLVLDDLSDQIDTLDVAGDVIEAVIDDAGDDERDEIAKAMARYRNQIRRFDDGAVLDVDPATHTVSSDHVLRDESGEPILDESGDPILDEGA